MAETWTTADGQHRAYVGRRGMRDVNGGSSTMPFGRCSCAWEGPGRIMRADAIIDLMDHLAVVTHQDVIEEVPDA